MSFFILNYITFLATAKLAVNWEKSSKEGCSFSLLLKISWKSIIIVRTPPPPPPPSVFKGGFDLTKNPKKGGDGKIAEGLEDPKKGGGGGVCRKGGMLLVWVFCLAAVWQM